MAIPSGSGTEVLKNGAVKSNNVWTKIRWDTPITAVGNTSTGTTAIPTNCIVTILNVSCTSTHSADLIFGMRVDIGSTDEIYIFNHSGTTIPAYNTFVYNEKIVLTPDNELEFYNSQTGDIYFNYIYQDWT